MINQLETEKILGEPSWGLDPISGNEDLYENNDELPKEYGGLSDEGLRGRKEITEELANEYFEAIDLSLLPF